MKKYFIYEITDSVREKECSKVEAVKKANELRKLINMIDKIRK